MMSDDGLLSQADIDALTAGLLGGGGSDDITPSGGGAGGGGLDPELMRPLVKLLAGQATSVVTTVISKNAEFKIEGMHVGDDGVLQGSTPPQALAVTVRFEKSLTGAAIFVFSKKDTAMLADLMMMGDGSAGFEEDHKDALSEMINQIMGSAGTSLADDESLPVSLSQAAVTDFDPTSLSFAPERAVVAELGLKIEEVRDTRLLVLLDEELVRSWGEAKGGASTKKSAPASASFGSPTPEHGVDPLAMLDMMGDVDEEPVGVQGGGGGLFESTGNRALDMLMDVPLNLTIELGRTEMSIRRILEVGPGSLLEMDRLAGEPVDLLINDKVVARGEVVVVDENFGIRIVSLVTPEERIKFLK